MEARVARLLEASRIAQAARDDAAANAVRDEAMELMRALVPMMRESDFRTAELPFEVAQLNLQYQIAAGNWSAAGEASAVLGSAAAAITHAIARRAFPDSWDRLRDLLAAMRNAGESAAFAAHQSGQLTDAVATLEAQTGIMFDVLMTRAAGRAAPPPADAGPRAARMTGRTILYVVPGFARNPGVAIRVNPDAHDESLTESMWLPGLRGQGLDAELDRIRNAYRTSNGSVRSLSGPVRRILDWTGTHVWDAIADRWPDLLSRQVAVVPVSRAALLPIYTATFRGEPACAVLDMTITPSARALHFAALGASTLAQADVFVAADAWFGGDALRDAGREAAAIAGLYGVAPVVYETPGPVPPGRNPDAVRRLKTATVAHLACRGVINRDNPALLLGGVVSLERVLGAGDSLLPGRPLVVLPACELGGFTGERISAEQYGFPAGLLAIGARAVVGALWPVPDSRALGTIMESLHRRLAEVPSHAALPQAIRDARNSEAPPAVWGSLAHFGV